MPIVRDNTSVMTVRVALLLFDFEVSLALIVEGGPVPQSLFVGLADLFEDQCLVQILVRENIASELMLGVYFRPDIYVILWTYSISRGY